MTFRSRLFRGLVAAVLAFVVVRFLFWPSQLMHTPYRDATLGSDLINQFFGDIPTPAWIVGAIASVSIFTMVIRWPLRQKTHASESV
jgi:hypothetical protein